MSVTNLAYFMLSQLSVISMIVFIMQFSMTQGVFSETELCWVIIRFDCLHTYFPFTTHCCSWKCYFWFIVYCTAVILTVRCHAMDWRHFACFDRVGADVVTGSCHIFVSADDAHSVWCFPPNLFRQWRDVGVPGYFHRVSRFQPVCRKSKPFA